MYILISLKHYKPILASVGHSLGDSWKLEIRILFQDIDMSTALGHLSVFAESAKFYDEFVRVEVPNPKI